MNRHPTFASDVLQIRRYYDDEGCTFRGHSPHDPDLFLQAEWDGDNRAYRVVGIRRTFPFLGPSRERFYEKKLDGSRFFSEQEALARILGWNEDIAARRDNEIFLLGKFFVVKTGDSDWSSSVGGLFRRIRPYQEAAENFGIDLGTLKPDHLLMDIAGRPMPQPSRVLVATLILS